MQISGHSLCHESLTFLVLPQQSPRPERKSESSDSAVTATNTSKDTKQLFHKNTKAIIWGMQTRAVQVCVSCYSSSVNLTHIYILSIRDKDCYLYPRKLTDCRFIWWPLLSINVEERLELTPHLVLNTTYNKTYVQSCNCDAFVKWHIVLQVNLTFGVIG